MESALKGIQNGGPPYNSLMRIGGFNASTIPYFTAVAVASAIVICEILAVRYGQEKPFPQATISATADHYPSYLVFRIAT